MKNKRLFYGILAVSVLAILGTLLFTYLSKPKVTSASSPESRIIVKQSGEAGFFAPEFANRSYITETSDYIIEGTVEKVESRWNDERTQILTYTDLTIERYVKGVPFTENKLQIVTSGGAVGEIAQYVEDQPIFHEGKKVRIYFKEVNGEFIIVGGHFGVEEI